MSSRSLIGPEESFQPGALEDIGGRHGIRSGTNLEKALWALEYMNQLSDAGLEFLLKGGTAVQLVTDPAWSRFSVDIDICTGSTVHELEDVLSSIDDRFEKGFEFEDRKSKNMDEGIFRSYKVTTPRIRGSHRTILLDAYLSVPDFRSQSTPVRSFFYDSDRTVRTPTVGCLAGDKMTITAPFTVGRALVDSRQGVEYSKHIFDIHRLVRSGPEPSDLLDAFRMVVEHQSMIRGDSFDLHEVIGDVTMICQVIATLNLPPNWTCPLELDLPLPIDRMRYILRRGVKDFRAFLASDVVFGVDELVTASGEVALIANSFSSEKDVSDAMARVVSGDLWDRSQAESRGLIDGATERNRWFIDHRAGLYSQRALAIWSEVVLTLEGHR